MTRGIIYIAYGEAARREARASIETLRRFGPIDVSVIGEAVPGARHIPFERRDQGGRWAKVNLDRLSPYDLTLYIDADTRVRQNVSAIFDLLTDGWDVVMAPSAQQGDGWLWHVGQAERNETAHEIGITGVQLQAGVIGFRKGEAVARLFSIWRDEWERWEGQDQAALLRALYREPVRVWLLGRPWNGGAVIEHRFGAVRGQ